MIWDEKNVDLHAGMQKLSGDLAVYIYIYIWLFSVLKPPLKVHEFMHVKMFMCMVWCMPQCVSAYHVRRSMVLVLPDACHQCQKLTMCMAGKKYDEVFRKNRWCMPACKSCRGIRPFIYTSGFFLSRSPHDFCMSWCMSRCSCACHISKLMFKITSCAWFEAWHWCWKQV